MTLIPKKLGYTSLILTEEDTGESVMIYVHVCEAYKAIEIYESTNSLDRGTVLASLVLTEKRSSENILWSSNMVGCMALQTA